MLPLNPPLTKQDFINSGCKEVVNSSERKECLSYHMTFWNKAKQAEAVVNIREQIVFEILAFVTGAAINPELNDEFFGEVFSNLAEEYLNFLTEIAPEISDPELQARVADILWVKNGNYQMAQLAVEAYLESAKQLEDPQKWTHCVDRIERSLRLARKINYKPEIVIEYIDEVLNRYQGEDPLWLSIKLHELLQDEKNINLLQKTKLLNTSKYSDLAKKGAIFQESSKEWDKVRNYWKIKAEWHRIEKNVEKAYTARMSAAETYIKESEDSLTKHPTPYFKASHDLQKAFEAFERLQSQGTEEEKAVIKNKLEQIHKRLLEYQQKSSNELITISSEFKFNISEEVELARSQVKGKEFPEAILALAVLATPPKVSELQKMVEENVVLSRFFPIVKMNEMGKVVARRNSNDEEKVIRYEMHVEAIGYQKIFAQAFIEPARKQIISEHIIQKSEDHKIKESYLLPLVSNNPFVPSGREHLFVKGLYAGLIGDFITSTHILIPQIENSVRYLLSNRGAITSGIDNKNNGIQQENNLNTTLFPSKYPQITSIFDEDTLFELQGLLIEKSGSNLRNRMAHGLINDNEFFSPIFSYLWWVTLRLCFGLGIEIPQEIVEESNPLVKFAGMFKHDPFFDEFVEEIAINRRKLDEEMVAEEASIEENHAA
ncbi:MAG: DUF4209 domain-containing protein [Aphanizomenon flos-aquae KM1D3_PB]|uniref:DUF4209 domain-containing protein n=1 Tax=Aphanizomenon flos-aquae TaxID=1176 RepID=UPI000541E3C9|nr:DUF4209 domain-containing protein [Aphanizomenon flos-aquae]KHG42736.1 hypothetical protein OA07_03295 [Aphanizomenon flos-aquae 2012/KM1/D3]QSV71122.1 MAG: DUF4209 domain-containing protein [Aphanizomenon flos-aquae KM1D3_PB]